MSDPQSKPEPTQGELIGSFIKLAQEFAGLAEDGSLMAEQHIRMAQEQRPKNIISKDPDPYTWLSRPYPTPAGPSKHSRTPSMRWKKPAGSPERRSKKNSPQDCSKGWKSSTPARRKTSKWASAKQCNHPTRYSTGSTNSPTTNHSIRKPSTGQWWNPSWTAWASPRTRREQTTINDEYCHWLKNADGCNVALLITDHRETCYGPEQADIDRLEVRQEQLHRETEFDRPFIFTNGMEWKHVPPRRTSRVVHTPHLHPRPTRRILGNVHVKPEKGGDHSITPSPG